MPWPWCSFRIPRRCPQAVRGLFRAPVRNHLVAENLDLLRAQVAHRRVVEPVKLPSGVKLRHEGSPFLRSSFGCHRFHVSISLGLRNCWPREQHTGGATDFQRQAKKFLRNRDGSARGYPAGVPGTLRKLRNVGACVVLRSWYKGRGRLLRSPFFAGGPSMCSSAMGHSRTWSPEATTQGQNRQRSTGG